MEAEAQPAKWEAGRDGKDQLRELYAMERNQDFNLWTASAIFVAGNAVLSIGFFQQEEHYLARMLISVIGLMVTAAWFVIMQRSRAYESRWIGKAKELQKALGLPQKFSVWEDEPPAGFSATKALLVMVIGFSVLWLVGVAFGAVNWLM